MGAFFPNLPSPENLDRYNPMVSLGRGMALGNEIAGQGLKNEAMGLELQGQQRKEQALQDYAKTRNTESLWRYSPETAVTMEKQLLDMDEKTRDKAIKQLTGAFDLTEKAMPYFLSASPDKAAQMWPQYVNDIKALGINIPAGFEQYNPEMLKGVMQLKEDAKTAVAKLNAAAKLKAAEMTSTSRLGAAGISADARKYAADKGLEGRQLAAQSTKTLWGKMAEAAQAGNTNEFDFYKNLWDQQHTGRIDLFENPKTKKYLYVPARPGSESQIPEGYQRVNVDPFKALMGGMIGDLQVPSPTATGESKSSAGPSQPMSLQEQAAAELARRRAAGGQ